MDEAAGEVLDARLTAALQPPDESPLVRTDDWTLHDWLCRTLQGMASQAEGRNREIVPLFVDEFWPIYTGRTQMRKLLGRSLQAFLGLFAKFTNPQGLAQGEELFAVFRTLLLSPNSLVQRAALDCLLAWRKSPLVPVKDALIQMVDETTFRVGLAELRDLEAVGDRDAVMDVVLRVLYGRILMRKGRSTQSTHSQLVSRRATILAFVASLSPADVTAFVSLMLDPLVRADGGAAGVEHGVLVGFTSLWSQMLGAVGFGLVHELPRVSALVIDAFRVASRSGATEQGRTLRAACCGIIATTLERFASSAEAAAFFASSLVPAAWAVIAEELSARALQDTNVSAILKLIRALALGSPERYWVMAPESVVAGVLGLLASAGASAEVILVVFDVLSGAMSTPAGTAMVRPHVSGLLPRLSGGVLKAVGGGKKLTPLSLSFLRVLALLAPLVLEESGSGDDAEQLCRLLLPFVASGRPDSQAVGDILDVFRTLLPRVSAGAVAECVPALARVLEECEAPETEDRVCAVVRAAGAAGMASFATAAPLVEGLLSYMQEEVGLGAGPDVDRRSEIVRAMREEEAFFVGWGETEWTLVAAAMSRMVVAPEAVLENLARFAWGVFVERLEGNMGLMRSVLLAAVQRGVQSRGARARDAWMRALGVIAGSPAVAAAYPDLAALREADVDFFTEVTHIQIGRRQKAFSKLVAACGEAKSPYAALPACAYSY